MTVLEPESALISSFVLFSHIPRLSDWTLLLQPLVKVFGSRFESFTNICWMLKLITKQVERLVINWRVCHFRSISFFIRYSISFFCMSRSLAFTVWRLSSRDEASFAPVGCNFNGACVHTRNLLHARRVARCFQKIDILMETRLLRWTLL